MPNSVWFLVNLAWEYLMQFKLQKQSFTYVQNFPTGHTHHAFLYKSLVHTYALYVKIRYYFVIEITELA